MGTEKRERQKANRAVRNTIEEAEWKRQHRRERFVSLLVALVSGCAVGAVAYLAVTSRGDDQTLGSDVTDTTDPFADATTTTLDEAQLTPCPEPDGSSPQTLSFDAPMADCVDPINGYEAIVETDAGTFTIELDAASSPVTVNNFVALARYHYFDDVIFHRSVPTYVIQTGDPTGDPPGCCGPGYTISDEFPIDPTDYKVGTVAMANGGPGTTGSQWFVLFDPETLLAGGGPQYSIVGDISEGLDVAEAINAGAVGGPNGDTPTDPATILSITIVEEEREPPTTTTTTSSSTTSSTTTTSTP